MLKLLSNIHHRTDSVCDSGCLLPVPVTDWFPIIKRTESCAVGFILGVRFGKHYIEINQTTQLKTSLLTSEEEKSVVNGHCNHLALKFLYVLRNAKTDFLRCIGYLSFTKNV